MAILAKSTAYSRMFKMISSTDHLSLKTGASPVVNISKAGGAFGAAGGAVTEVANGWYKVALNTTDTGTVGDLAYYITGTGADDTDFVDQVADPTVALFGVNTVQLNAQTVTAAAGVTFPTSVASPTNITAGTITTVGTLTTYTNNTPQTGDAYLRLGAPALGSISADIAAAPTTLLDQAAGVETNITLRQGLRLMLAAMAGKASGMATTSAIIRDTNDTKNRITATVDVNGNRTAVSYDVT